MTGTSEETYVIPGLPGRAKVTARSEIRFRLIMWDALDGLCASEYVVWPSSFDGVMRNVWEHAPYLDEVCIVVGALERCNKMPDVIRKDHRVLKGMDVLWIVSFPGDVGLRGFMLCSHNDAVDLMESVRGSMKCQIFSYKYGTF